MPFYWYFDGIVLRWLWLSSQLGIWFLNLHVSIRVTEDKLERRFILLDLILGIEDKPKMATSVS